MVDFLAHTFKSIAHAVPLPSPPLCSPPPLPPSHQGLNGWFHLLDEGRGKSENMKVPTSLSKYEGSLAFGFQKPGQQTFAVSFLLEHFVSCNHQWPWLTYNSLHDFGSNSMEFFPSVCKLTKLAPNLTCAVVSPSPSHAGDPHPG